MFFSILMFQRKPITLAMAATNMEYYWGKLLYTRVLERFFHAIQSVTLQVIKAGHENGLGMRLISDAATESVSP